MKIIIPPGTYVVAVSGGIDSIALLHMMVRRPGVECIVAHFDHGIRPDSAQDRELVQTAAKRYGVQFQHAEGRLGPRASEQAARRARYDFLRQAQQETGAIAIITAHHKDDVLETAIINIIRGTGPKGLSSLQSTPEMLRPLLGADKLEIVQYARQNKLVWREDSTNQDTKYLRNHIRHNIVPRLTPAQKQAFLAYIHTADALNQEIDTLLQAYLISQKNHGGLDRGPFVMLPHAVARETMATWLRGNNIRSFDKKMLEQLTRGSKILKAGTRISIDKATFLKVGKEFLALERLER